MLWQQKRDNLFIKDPPPPPNRTHHNEAEREGEELWRAVPHPPNRRDMKLPSWRSVAPRTKAGPGSAALRNVPHRK